MGIPITISENGTPFVEVESNAPLAKVSASGLGTPVRLVDNGAPALVIDRGSNSLIWNMVAGSGSGATGYQKYSDIGKLSNLLVAGEDVTEILTVGENPSLLEFVVDGDVTEQLGGKNVYVNDGEPIPVTWYYDTNSNATHIGNTNVNFSFVSGETYKIEVK